MIPGPMRAKNIHLDLQNPFWKILWNLFRSAIRKGDADMVYRLHLP
jgi:hypothetical protein